MVRVKHRYLLVQILTPSFPTKPTKPTRTSTLLPKSTTAINPPLQAHQHHQNPPQPTPLLIHIHSPSPETLTAPALLTHLRYTIVQLFGDHGAALAGSGLAIKYWSAATSTFIVRCRRECLRLVWAAVTWCTMVPVGAGGGRGKWGGAGVKEKEVVMRVVRVSGTIVKCEEEAVRRARALCGRVKGVRVAVEGGVRLGRDGGGGGGVGQESDGLGGGGEIAGPGMGVAEKDVFGDSGGEEEDGEVDVA